MPTNVVKTPEDERLWQKAKARAKEQGKPDNYAYIMGIYKQMNSERFKSAQRVATRYAAASPDMDALSRAIEIHADIHPVERDGSSMADLTLWIGRERDPVSGRHP